MTKKKDKLSRRGFMKKGLLVSDGTEAALHLKEAGAETKQEIQPPKAAEDDKLLMGQIGNVKVSRLICGGNLITGYAHSRDLVYVSQLFKHYFTDDKVMDTLQLCEENGINAILTGRYGYHLISKYWKERGGKIQWIAEALPEANDLETDIKACIDGGAPLVYVQGEIGDAWFDQGRIKLLGKSIDIIRKNGVPAGIGAHKLEVLVACEKAGIHADFYMKTLNSKNYWSARHPEEHDNIWSKTPEKTIEFMKKITKPWIAFKILAAGAISPTSGFKYALKNGADFLCVGMFDFQVKEDMQILKGLFARGIQRERPWRG